MSATTNYLRRLIVRSVDPRQWSLSNWVAGAIGAFVAWWLL